MKFITLEKLPEMTPRETFYGKEPEGVNLPDFINRPLFAAGHNQKKPPSPSPSPPF
jgi:hypothetical protein